MAPPKTFNDRIDSAVSRGGVALEQAGSVRRKHRRKSPPGSGTRQKDIAYSITKIDHAMKEIRRLIGRLPWNPHDPGKGQALREVSGGLQYERRQLKKMRRRS